MTTLFDVECLTTYFVHQFTPTGGKFVRELLLLSLELDNYLIALLFIIYVLSISLIHLITAMTPTKINNLRPSLPSKTT